MQCRDEVVHKNRPLALTHSCIYSNSYIAIAEQQAPSKQS